MSKRLFTKGNIPWNKGSRKQFCIHQHDTFVFGRNPANGSCKKCNATAARKAYYAGKAWQQKPENLDKKRAVGRAWAQRAYANGKSWGQQAENHLKLMMISRRYVSRKYFHDDKGLNQHLERIINEFTENQG